MNRANTSSPQTGENEKNSTAGPLSGIRVLDFTRILSGPFATMNLADLGADVIKVERPDQGDDTRQWGPPFQGGQAAYFLSVNRNKRSVVLDLKSPEDHEAARHLANQVDVIVENFRPGTMARLGLGYDEISRANPSIVYASISGYGQTGPDASRAGYDAIAQARSGLMSITGEEDGPPDRVGISPSDLTAGMWALVGILAALYQREQDGHGQWIDISLLDGQVSWLTYVAAGYLASGKVPHRYGSAHPTIVPYQAFPTQDSSIMIAVGNDSLWRKFTEALGLQSLTEDPRFIHNPERIANRDELIGMLTQALKTRPTDEWLAILDKAGIPSGPVNTVDKALEDPQLLSRGMIAEVEHPDIKSLKLVNCPLKMSNSFVGVRTAPPLLGEHTNEVLSEVRENLMSEHTGP